MDIFMRRLFKDGAAVAFVLEIEVFRDIVLVGRVGDELIADHLICDHVVLGVFDRGYIGLISSNKADVSVVPVG